MIREINLNVDRNGKISTTDDNFAGVCGETGATSIKFNVSQELLTAIKAQISDKTLYYRFEVTDALSRHFCLENNLVGEANTFSLPITNAFTMSEGKLTVALVFESEELTLCTLPIDLKLEKGCTGTPDNQQVYSTIVTIFDQAEKQITSEIARSTERCEQAELSANKILSDATNRAEALNTDTANTANNIINEINSATSRIIDDATSQAEAIKTDTANIANSVLKEINRPSEKKLSEATDLAQAIKTDTVNTANGILEEINNTAENNISSMNTLLERSQTTLTECEQRKNAAEAAALSAIESANSAAESKTHAEEILSAKEDLSNKETNLMQDVLADHTKYASAKATQELVNALANSLGDQMYNSDMRLEGLKADKEELEATNALLAVTQQELAETQQGLSEAKAEIEKLKTAEDFVLVGDITCDGATKDFYLRNLSPLKKVFFTLVLPEALSESLKNFSCYANTFSGSGNAIVVVVPTEKTRIFRFYTERIANGVWKTDTQEFSATTFGASWNTSYAGSSIDYITALKISCGDGETLFLPQGTTIKVYGVKA